MDKEKQKKSDTNIYKEWMRIDWLEYVKTKNQGESDHEEDRPNDDSKAENCHPQKIKTDNSIQILVSIFKKKKIILTVSSIFVFHS